MLLISSGRLRVYRFSQPCLKSYHYLCPYGEMVMEWEFLCTDARRDECLSRFCSFNHCACLFSKKKKTIVPLPLRSLYIFLSIGGSLQVIKFCQTMYVLYLRVD